MPRRFSRRLQMWVLLAALVALATIAAAQAKHTVTSERAKAIFDADFASGGTLKLDVRSSGVTLAGSPDARIHVRLEPQHSADLSDARIRFTGEGNSGDLRVTGGPDNNFKVRIEVPRNTNLVFRMFAGQLDLFDVIGNKDVQISAGQVTIQMGRPEDYGRVEASVWSGEVQARPYNVDKGGLFRSFEHSGPGKLKLYAHVGAGQITLE